MRVIFQPDFKDVYLTLLSNIKYILNLFIVHMQNDQTRNKMNLMR